MDDLMKDLKVLACATNDISERIAEVTKKISTAKLEIAELENSIQSKKNLISRNVLFNMPELKNEAQRNNEIAIQIMADSHISNFNEKLLELKNQVMAFEYDKVVLKSQYEYYQKMYYILMSEKEEQSTNAYSLNNLVTVVK